MNKKTAELIITENSFNEIKEFANLNYTSITFIVATALKTWYEANKERLENKSDTHELIKCKVQLDEETEKIYKIFVEDYINNLLKHIYKD